MAFSAGFWGDRCPIIPSGRQPNRSLLLQARACVFVLALQEPHLLSDTLFVVAEEQIKASREYTHLLQTEAVQLKQEQLRFIRHSTDANLKRLTSNACSIKQVMACTSAIHWCYSHAQQLSKHCPQDSVAKFLSSSLLQLFSSAARLHSFWPCCKPSGTDWWQFLCVAAFANPKKH